MISIIGTIIYVIKIINASQIIEKIKQIEFRVIIAIIAKGARKLEKNLLVNVIELSLNNNK